MIVPVSERARVSAMWRQRRVPHLMVPGAIVLLMLIVVVVGALAADPPDPAAIENLGIEDKVDAVVEAVVTTQKATSSLVAHFEQQKTSDLLLEPVVSRGTFRYLADDRVRWDYREPEEMVVVFNGELLTTYYPREHRAEQARIGSRQRRFVRFLGGAQPLDELLSQFQMAFADPGDGRPYEISLKPMSRMLRERLQSIQLQVDRELLLPVDLVYREPDGDSTRFTFTEIERNIAVDAGVFDLQLGPDVSVESVAVGSNPVY